MDRGLSQERTGEESETRVGNKTERAQVCRTNSSRLYKSYIGIMGYILEIYGDTGNYYNYMVSDATRCSFLTCPLRVLDSPPRSF